MFVYLYAVASITHGDYSNIEPVKFGIGEMGAFNATSIYKLKI